MKYYMHMGLRYNVTQYFFNLDGEQNRKDANSYLETKNGEEGVIWASSDNVMIVICRNDDLGTRVEWDEKELLKKEALGLAEFNRLYTCNFGLTE
jgi:hypothetical protein